MARGRKGGKGRRSTRVRKDWVYRPDEIAETLVNYGAYGGQRPLTDGPANAASFILYDSTDYLKYSTESNNVNGGYPAMPRAARAEGKLPTAYAVQGVIGVRMTSWTLQDFYRIGIRVGWFEQDLPTGLLALEGDYTMWDLNTFFAEHGPAIYANEKNGHFAEWRISDYSVASATNYLKYRRIMWRGARRAPSSKHCLAFYIESPPGSAAFNLVDSYCRSLISDEG